MNSRTPELSRLTLMCSDHEVAEFTWNHDRQAVTGKTHVLDAAHAPLMATDPSGNITRDRLSSWFKNRGIPDFRPDAADRLRAVGYPSAASRSSPSRASPSSRASTPPSCAWEPSRPWPQQAWGPCTDSS